MPTFRHLSALCLLLPLASCASMKKAGGSVARVGTSSVTKVGDSMAKAGDAVTKFSVTDLMPSRIKVVEVREKDLQEIQLGKERALAFSNHRDAVARKSDRGFWRFFQGPAEFKEPVLPAGGDPALGDGLLPPRS